MAPRAYSKWYAIAPGLSYEFRHKGKRICDIFIWMNGVAVAKRGHPGTPSSSHLGSARARMARGKLSQRRRQHQTGDALSHLGTYAASKHSAFSLAHR